jgi:hypothetical protein
VEPDHLEWRAWCAAAVLPVVSDAAVGVYELGPEGWQRVERRLPYSRDFDPDLLALDNYIPFNTLLMRRDLVREAGPFDRLRSSRTGTFCCAYRSPPFHHPGVTCSIALSGTPHVW